MMGFSTGGRITPRVAVLANQVRARKSLRGPHQDDEFAHLIERKSEVATSSDKRQVMNVASP